MGSHWTAKLSKRFKFQLCETIGQNVQNGMNYMEVAISVPGMIKLRLISYLSE